MYCVLEIMEDLGVDGGYNIKMGLKEVKWGGMD